MTRFVALLRAVNVGGRGKLAMADLAEAGRRVGFSDVSTYIASGNLLFSTDRPDKAAADLERGMEAVLGRTPPFTLRSADEIARTLASNPFPESPGNFTVAIFLDTPPADPTRNLRNRSGERIAAMGREIFVAYPEGQGKSRLVIPAAKDGTARNLNTVAKLAALLG